jgi:hypothetical protein
MQKGDLVDHHGKLVRIVSVVDDSDVLVDVDGYGSAPVLVSRAELGKKVFRPYGGGFEGEFTSAVNDNKGIVLAVIGAGAVLTGILLFSKPAAAASAQTAAPAAPPPHPSPLPAQHLSSPPPPPHQTASASSPAKAPAPVPRAPSPPKAPRPPAGAPSAPSDDALFGNVPMPPQAAPGVQRAGADVLAAMSHFSGLPAPVGSRVPIANIPGAGSLPAPMGSFASTSPGENGFEGEGISDVLSHLFES